MQFCLHLWQLQIDIPSNLFLCSCTWMINGEYLMRQVCSHGLLLSTYILCLQCSPGFYWYKTFPGCLPKGCLFHFWSGARLFVLLVLTCPARWKPGTVCWVQLHLVYRCWLDQSGTAVLKVGPSPSHPASACAPNCGDSWCHCCQWQSTCAHCMFPATLQDQASSCPSWWPALVFFAQVLALELPAWNTAKSEPKSGSLLLTKSTPFVLTSWFANANIKFMKAAWSKIRLTKVIMPFTLVPNLIFKMYTTLQTAANADSSCHITTLVLCWRVTYLLCTCYNMIIDSFIPHITSTKEPTTTSSLLTTIVTLLKSKQGVSLNLLALAWTWSEIWFDIKLALCYWFQLTCYYILHLTGVIQDTSWISPHYTTAKSTKQ